MSINVLIPNIGRRGYLVEYLKAISNDVKVYVSDCDKTASGLFTKHDGCFIFPRPVEDPAQYVDMLINTCCQYNIRVIIPVIDPEIAILSEYKSKFNKNNIFVSVSEKPILDICYNKLAMNSFLQNNGFLVPKTFQSVHAFSEALSAGIVGMPAIIKPIYGSGSASTYKVETMAEIKALFHEGHMIQEFISGQEYGADIFNDINGTPVRCVLKRKISMRSGETDKALTIKNSTMQAEAIRLATALSHIANLDCDLIEKDGKYYFIDLNPRFGGGYPATHAAGVNLLKLVIDMSLGKTISPDYKTYQEGILVMKEIAIRSAKVDFL